MGTVFYKTTDGMGKNPLPLLLYVSPNGYLGGAERFVVEACHAHLRAGHYLPHALFFRPGEAVELARSRGIPCTVLAHPFRLTNPISLAAALAEIRMLHDHLNPAVVHATMPYAHIVVSLALAGRRTKRVWFQHGPVGGTLDRIGGIFATDAMLYNGQFLLERHRRTCLQWPVRRGHNVISLGVAGDPSPRRLFAGPEVVFGAAGRITPGKAFERLISAVKAAGPGARLRVAGAAKTPDDEAYEALLRQEASPQVEFLGHVADMGAFYRSVDVFLHASLTPEPFGLVIAEAMAHGCLILAPAGGGISSLLRNRETGLTYADEGELQHQVEALAQTRERTEFAACARRGQQEAQAGHSMEAMAQQLEKLYNSL